MESGEDSGNRLATGDLALKNNIWWDINSKTNPSLTDIAPDVPDEVKDGKTIKGYSLQPARDYLANADNGNKIVDPGLSSLDRGQNELFNPTPMANSSALTSSTTKLNDNFIKDVNYLGAFGLGDYWLANWTGLYFFEVTSKDVSTSVTIEEIEGNDNQFNLYPNPVQNVFTLSGVNLKRAEIFTTTGKLVRTLSLNSINTVDVNELRSGAYIIKVYDNANKSAISRFIKQ